MFSFKIRAGVPPSKEPLFTFFIEQTTDLAATTQFSGMYAPFTHSNPNMISYDNILCIIDSSTVTI